MSERLADHQPSTPAHLRMLLFAGAGSVEAQRDVCDVALAAGEAGAVPLGRALAVAEVMAWMALRSCDPADFRKLASIELRMADEISESLPQRTVLFALAINFFDLAADAGDGDATRMLEGVIGRAPAEAIEMAKIMRGEWEDMLVTIAAEAAAAEAAAAKGAD